jgi:hypothetical protein
MSCWGVSQLHSASPGVSIPALPVAAAALFLLSGCTFADPYPASWVALSSALSADCRHIQGSYSERGESSNPYNRSGSLTSLIFGQTPRATRVNLALPKTGMLEVTGWEDTTRLFSRALTTQAGEFACETGVAVVRRTQWQGQGQGAGRSQFTVELSTAGDHLVIKETEFAVGLAVVVPVAGTGTHWYRFARLGELSHRYGPFERQITVRMGLPNIAVQRTGPGPPGARPPAADRGVRQLREERVVMGTA